jgi:hypothetical protein
MTWKRRRRRNGIRRPIVIERFVAFTSSIFASYKLIPLSRKTHCIDLFAMDAAFFYILLFVVRF